MASTLTVDNIQGATTAGKIHIPGHVINTQSVNFTGTQAHAYTSGNSYIDITNLSITMTPAASDSKFLVSCIISCASDAHFVFLRLVRNGSAIATPDGSGSFNRQTASFGYSSLNNGSQNYDMIQVPFQTLDAPNTTSNVTYKVQFTGRADTGTVRINRTTRDLDHSNGYDQRGVSTLTVMEIAQ